MTAKSPSQFPDLSALSPGQHPRPRLLPLVEDIKHVSPELLTRVRSAVVSARRKIEGLIANDDGQGMLFPDLADEIAIPEDEADEVIQNAQSQLYGTGIALVKKEDSIRVVADMEHEDPQESIGYNR